MRIFVFLSFFFFSLKVEAQYKLMEIDTHFVTQCFVLHQPEYCVKLENHADGNYIVYYFDDKLPLKKCLEYSVLNHQFQGLVEQYDVKGELIKQEYYSEGKLLFRRKIKNNKAVDFERFF